jgi:hypothetical protein
MLRYLRYVLGPCAGTQGRPFPKWHHDQSVGVLCGVLLRRNMLVAVSSHRGVSLEREVVQDSRAL